MYDQTVLNAMRSAADAVVDYQSLKSRQDTWNKMVNIADKSVQNAKGRVRAGLDNGLTALQKTRRSCAYENVGSPIPCRISDSLE